MNFESQNWIKNLIEKQKKFWEKDYHKLSKKDRKSTWSRVVYSIVRRQPEENPDFYTSFSKKWYAWAKSVEPEFDSFFEEIVNDPSGYLMGEFDWEKYKNQILK